VQHGGRQPRLCIRVHPQIHAYVTTLKQRRLVDDDTLDHRQQRDHRRCLLQVFFPRQHEQGIHGSLELLHGLCNMSHLHAMVRRKVVARLHALAGAADHRQRRAQFMAGIAGEFAFAVHECLDAYQQPLQRTGQCANFIVGQAFGESGR